MISVKNVGQGWGEKERTEFGEEKSFKEDFLSFFHSQTPILGLDICLGASHRSASLVVVQPGDQRNSLETATETPRLLDGDILQRVLERQLNTTSEQDTATAFAIRGRRLPFTGRIDVSCQGLIKPYN